MVGRDRMLQMVSGGVEEIRKSVMGRGEEQVSKLTKAATQSIQAIDVPVAFYQGWLLRDNVLADDIANWSLLQGSA